jgi:hypothetical protein
MGAVLELENRFIRYTYYLILVFTLMVNGETLKSETSSFPILLIGSTIGVCLFWFIEFAARQVALPEKTEQTKRLLGIIVLGRCAVLGVLICFLLYFLLSLDSRDVIFALKTCVIIYVPLIVYNWLRERVGIIKELEMFYLASSGLIIFLALCIGYFLGKWIGGKFGDASIGANIGLVLGVATGLVQGFRMEKHRREAAQKARDTKKDNLLRINNDSPLF